MKTVLILALAAAAAAVGLRWFVLRLEPRAAFFPSRGETFTPERYGLAFERVPIRTADGERLAAWWLPAGPGAPQVLFFHGNGGNLSLWSDVIAGIRRQGWSVFALDYRGYGLSSGSPTEAGVYRDADAFLQHFWSGQEGGGGPVVYWGRSLGATVAAYAASKRPPDALVLESPFFTARSLISDNLVMRLLSVFMSYRLATTEFLEDYRGPTLVVHGDSDSIVPLRHGKRVYEAISGPKELVLIPGADHNDLHAVSPDRYWVELRRFVARLQP